MMKQRRDDVSVRKGGVRQQKTGGHSGQLAGKLDNIIRQLQRISHSELLPQAAAQKTLLVHCVALEEEQSSPCVDNSERKLWDKPEVKQSNTEKVKMIQVTRGDFLYYRLLRCCRHLNSCSTFEPFLIL